MGSVLNESFEQAGESAGEAESWRLECLVSGRTAARFGDPGFGFEDFEWYAAADFTGAVRMFFDLAPHREGFEDFEEGWGNDDDVFGWSDGFAAPAVFDDVVTEEFEDFEEGWDNDGGVLAWADISAEAGAFDEGDVDGFELSPDPVAWGFGAAEWFEADWTEATTI